MPGERKLLSLSPRGRQLLEDLADFEGVTGSQLAERALETRLGLVELASRIPRDERGRLVRMAILPEGVSVPRGAEVFRLYVPMPEPDERQPDDAEQGVEVEAQD